MEDPGEAQIPDSDHLLIALGMKDSLDSASPGCFRDLSLHF